MLRKFRLIVMVMLVVCVVSGCKISGTITHNETGLENVLVRLEGENLVLTTTTDESGYYEFESLSLMNATFTITPSICGYVFDPETRNVDMAYSHVTGVDFQSLMEPEFSLGDEFCLNYQQTRENTDENISITFEELISDNRCPIDALCIWAGNAEIELTFTQNDNSTLLYLNTPLEPRMALSFGYKIELISLSPYPSLEQGVISPENYVAYLRITESMETCIENSDCDDTEYCAKAVNDCDGEGQCNIKPEECSMVWAPVCGCDYQTYGNACSAAQAGVNILHSGECCPQLVCSLDCEYGIKKDENGCETCECIEPETVEDTPVK